MLRNDSFVPATYTDIMVVFHSPVITLEVEPNFSTTDLPVHTTVQPVKLSPREQHHVDGMRNSSHNVSCTCIRDFKFGVNLIIYIYVIV